MTARRWVDPFDDMTDDEFDVHIEQLFSKRPQTVGVSLRVSRDLLERVKREAGREGIPYQTFMKGILEAAVARFERRPRARLAAGATRRPARRRARTGA